MDDISNNRSVYHFSICYLINFGQKNIIAAPPIIIVIVFILFLYIWYTYHMRLRCDDYNIIKSMFSYRQY